ncbi:neutral zinc metallopeptidase [Palleronia marisminoris]|uniref:KPN_02809 family neutral zinc metallopeptidase n=1 Tax=Palleronia marisminoris TaxID=315423 RepID=UPI000A26EC85|nr:neutral zinc metallopeptidase [Palleronia marisminoris]
MRLRRARRSGNVIDRRGRGGGKAVVGGIGGLGFVAIVVVSWALGVDPRPLLDIANQSGSTSQPRELTPAEQDAGDFAARVLATTEDVWSREFPEQIGEPYEVPELVLFSGTVQSQCGGASAATGPFYCPADQRAYLDTEFFATLEQNLGAEGDFAAAYVIAHEVGHHVQNQLGILGDVHARKQGASQSDANALQVRVELMADCFSGVWARGVEGLLEPGDIEEAINAAQRIGDDYLQKRAGKAVTPHTFTHGTSEQRARWFENGYRTGDVADCDTFAASTL